MYVLLRLRKALSKYMMSFSWQGVFGALLAYLGVAWLLLLFAGEKEIIAANTFFYWILVTASTVGYGDISPSTTVGKHVVAFFIIPVGIGLFAMIVGRIAVFVSTQWRKGVMGYKSLHAQDHIVVIGWNQQRTLLLLNLLLEELKQGEKKQIVLCVTKDIENPLPEYVEFVKARVFNDQDDMARACIDKASTIIIDTPLDDVTMTTALFCFKQNPTAHIIAYFMDESLSALLKSHCPSIECTPSVSVEMLAKAAMDPGSSALHQQLLNATRGTTQYSIHYPENCPETKVEPIFEGFKKHHNATFIGIKSLTNGGMVLNPGLSDTIEPGCTLYYISESRIKNIDWQALYV